VADTRSDQPVHWQTAQQLQAAPPAALLDWLFDQNSLTRRLTTLSQQRFSVQPLHQGWQSLRPDECEALGARPHSQGWVREVLLLGAGQPWVFARSVATREALQGSGLNLEQLGSRSLGELLFSDSAFSRGELQASLYPAAWLPEAVRSGQLWARRSCFRRGELAVLVAEVFLPALWEQSASPP
jgi:chorismate--pyruvate lyase